MAGRWSFTEYHDIARMQAFVAAHAGAHPA